MVNSIHSAPKPAPKLEDTWRQARLIPTTGIGGQDEQEQRATSSLLAVMRAVPQFGHALLSYLSAPNGHIETFGEVHFLDADEKTSIPDGGIIIERGKLRWVCLVEVKTGASNLRLEQIERYLDLAKNHGIDGLLTISNQITVSPLESPLLVDSRKTKKVALRHLSWWQIMTEARVLHEHKGIDDPDQAWILGELIAYLDHSKSGAGGFEGMGESWVSIRDGARAHVLKLSDQGVHDVAVRWEQFVQYLSLGLCQTLGRDVSAIWAKDLSPIARQDRLIHSLVEKGRLEASIRVPAAASPIELTADLPARLFTASVELAAPKEGRALTRVNWILRQLKDSPDSVRIEAHFHNVKETISATIKDIREKPERLLLKAEPHREPRSFHISLTEELGTKRGKAAGSFVAESKQQLLNFYRTVVQELKPWNETAPKLPVSIAIPDPSPAASPLPPDFGSLGREFGDASLPKV
jgi:tRNA A37 threonylcarbamoyladenosine synthetase subunit TsaC/SUA5/YrdC